MKALTISTTVGFVLALGLAAGCSIDDRKITVTDGTVASGGAGGSGGTGGSKGGAGGSSGTGGSKGGMAGKGGSSGSTGGLSDATDCNGDALAVDDTTIKACLLQIGCNPLYPVASVSSCITYQRLKTFSLDDCGTGVDSCDGYLSCSGVGYYPTADCSGSAVDYCDGNIAVRCSDVPYAIDCTSDGGTCGTYTDGNGDTRAWCKQPTVGACVDTGQAECSGSIVYSCYGGEAFGVDCSIDGGRCAYNNGDANCYYTLPSCPTPGATCGNSTRVDECYSDNSLAKYNCDDGLSCLDGDTAVACVAPGCDDTTACSESCSGSMLTFCYGSVPVTVDCTTYGFRECLETTLSDRSTPTALCIDPMSAAP